MNLNLQCVIKPANTRNGNFCISNWSMFITLDKYLYLTK